MVLSAGGLFGVVEVGGFVGVVLGLAEFGFVLFGFVEFGLVASGFVEAGLFELGVFASGFDGVCCVCGVVAGGVVEPG